MCNIITYVMENKEKRILYLMSVPWGWIKQRPHFLAEELAKYYKVDVYYKKSTAIKSKNLLTDLPEDIHNLQIRYFRVFPFYAIPIIRNLKLDIINTLLCFFQFPAIKRYDYVWVPSPRLYNLIAPLLSDNQKVIFDCMDDAAEFGNYSEDSPARKAVLENEKRLLKRTDFLFFSASYLRDKVLGRAGMLHRESLIVNNAIEMPDKTTSLSIPREMQQKIDVVKQLSRPLMYIGTIAEWFDFETVIKALNQDKKLNLVLIGPNNVAIPTHPQIHYLGTIKRDFIFNFMDLAYALVMPFKVNELIKSVNPVKLYEYIYTGKTVIAPRYQESEAFSEFVYLYSSFDEFVEAINSGESAKKGEKYLQRCEDFLRKNTWKKRCDIIHDYLEIR